MFIDLTGGNSVMIIVLFIAGLICIVKGGDYFVDAATWIAEASGIPKFIIGATVVSFATTLPEMLVSVFAALQGNADIAVGNAVGSVTANTGLIMCVSLICMPCMMHRKQFGFNAVCLLAAVASLFVLTFWDGNLSVTESIFILVIFAAFASVTVMTAKREQGNTSAADETDKSKKTIFVNVAKFLGGTFGIVLGAQLLIDNGTALAKLVGVPDAIIAATMIAIGTSLPELVTTVTAIRKKQSSLSVGNIIGANIMDLTLIMPICAIIRGKPLIVENQGRALDIPASLIINGSVMIAALAAGKFKKWHGYMIGGLYIAYLAVMFIFFGA